MMPMRMQLAMIYGNLYGHDRIRQYKSLYITRSLHTSAAQRAALQARL